MHAQAHGSHLTKTGNDPNTSYAILTLYSYCGYLCADHLVTVRLLYPTINILLM